jgi:hypothetical protein
MPQEMAMLQLLNQTGNGWLTAALLTGLLLALLFKPERIYSWALMRLSCWLLAVSIAIPPMLNAYMPSLANGFSFQSSRIGISEYLIMPCICALGPILVGTSVICGLLAMIPTGYRPPLTPPKHPLE